MRFEYEKNIICPFFLPQHISGSCKDGEERERLVRKRMRCIKCEGVYEDTFIFLDFNSESAKEEHRRSFCTSYGWETCPIAIMLKNEKYGVQEE